MDGDEVETAAGEPCFTTAALPVWFLASLPITKSSSSSDMVLAPVSDEVEEADELEETPEETEDSEEEEEVDDDDSSEYVDAEADEAVDKLELSKRPQKCRELGTRNACVALAFCCSLLSNAFVLIACSMLDSLALVDFTTICGCGDCCTCLLAAVLDGSGFG